MKTASLIDDLLAIMVRLRDPEHGCPWDLRQNFRTILPYTLEEAYEVAETIEQENMDDLRDELGDLLLQVVFHAQLADEQGSFAFADVVRGIRDKMLRRHSHVFGEPTAADEQHINTACSAPQPSNVFGGPAVADEQRVQADWERGKAAERTHKSGAEASGVLAGVARALPALVRAEKLQRRAGWVGFDWDEVAGVLDKVREELSECEQTLAAPADVAARVHEVGDLLFACVNLARHLGVDAEQALRTANRRFETRFALVEAGLRDRGKAPGPDVRGEMERLWEMAKVQEKDGCAS